MALSPEILAVIGAYEWTGNVRELRNFVARSVLGIDPPNAPKLPASVAPLSEARRQLVEDL